MRTIAAILAGLALVGCGGESGRVAQARNLVAQKLNDPNSAQFQKIETFPDKVGGTIVCGEVNAKNLMGGYTGFRRFYVQSNIVKIQPEHPAVADPLAKAEAIVEDMKFDQGFNANCG